MYSLLWIVVYLSSQKIIYDTIKVHPIILMRSLKRTTEKTIFNHMQEIVRTQIVQILDMSTITPLPNTNTRTNRHTVHSHTNMQMHVHTHTHLPVTTPENSALFLLSSFSSLLPLLSHSLAPSGDDSLGCRAAPLSSAGSVFVSCSFEVLI